jgi:nucleoside-diphosphate-sugar epimerase
MLLDVLRPFHPSRIVYLSTTGVYGAAETVDERTVAAPDTERDLERVQTENLICSGSWSSLVLRPAAIYGPHRGVHTSARSGVFRPPPGGNRIVSRIHVDDLAAQVLAGLESDITGAFPVADEESSTSLEVAKWTATFLGVQLLPGESETAERKKGRRVDGSAYRRAVGLPLRYPSFRQGVPACLREEGALR